MKNIAVLLFALLLVSCSSGDDNSTRETDPFIGNWSGSVQQTLSGDGQQITITSTINFAVQSGGQFSQTVTLSPAIDMGEDAEDLDFTGTWRNTSSSPNFSSRSQTYVLVENGATEDDDSDMTILFSADFNTFDIGEADDEMGVVTMRRQ